MSGGIQGSDETFRRRHRRYKCSACGHSWFREAHSAKPRERCSGCGTDVRVQEVADG